MDRLPVPASCRKPIAVLAWYDLLKSCWSAAVGAVLMTVFAVVVAILAWRHIAPANIAVVILFGVGIGFRGLSPQPNRELFVAFAELDEVQTLDRWGGLMLSSKVPYLVANADQSGPAAVAAWQAWRTAYVLTV